MHEYSLMQALLELISSELESYPGYSVQGFVVGVGTLSGVEPELLETAFEALRGGTVAEHARMTIKRISLICRCTRCGKTYEPSDLDLSCHRCVDARIEILQGGDVVLESVELEEN